MSGLRNALGKKLHKWNAMRGFVLLIAIVFSISVFVTPVQAVMDETKQAAEAQYAVSARSF